MQKFLEVKGMTVDLSSAQWFKSTYSGPNCDNCVEVAFVGEAIAVRDSKNPTGSALVFTPDEWAAFVDGPRPPPAYAPSSLSAKSGRCSRIHASTRSESQTAPILSIW